MLHVKPSKFDRARVIPIGDGLGRVIAEIIRHVKGFYGTDRVPTAITTTRTRSAHCHVRRICCRAVGTAASRLS
jgi:hypothetical protein